MGQSGIGYYLLAANFLSCILMGVDKQISKGGQNVQRVPERTFFGLALIGGGPGILLSTWIFNHKHSKTSFMVSAMVATLIPVIFYLSVQKMAYLSIEARQNLHKYQYKGGDNSYLYNYVLSPMASYLVLYIPETIHPNIVNFNQLSLMGMMCCFGMYFLTFLPCGQSMECRVPDFMILWSALLYFGWLILDNLDGKQARRTSTSSPLGMIVDHQVDALSVTITATFFNTIALFGDSTDAFILWFVGAIPFYMATWEELHIGTMIFPVISGPAEGCVGLGMLSLFIWYKEPEYLTQTLINGIQLKYVLLYGLAIGAALAAIYNTLNVLSKCENKLKAWNDIWPLIYLGMVSLVVIYGSQENLSITATREMLLFIGFIFAREIFCIQLAHTTDMEYFQLRGANFWLPAILALGIIGNYWKLFVVSEYALLIALLSVSVFSYCHIAYNAGLEIS